jgi:hypothetical protein
MSLKMLTSHYVVLLIALILSLSLSCNAGLSVVYIRTSVGVHMVHFDCGASGTFTGAGKIIVDYLADTVCLVTWKNLQGAFVARDAEYDVKKGIIYWLVKPDGFYHSWDNHSWEKRANWKNLNEQEYSVIMILR